ncbi:class II glutamine amidotransferase [Nocardia asteroides]|uniref:class II glutamine amidotransferase n=1 Tax=Nocardia asteroides TaxID=1824 RepID=UPI0033E0BF17
MCLLSFIPASVAPDPQALLRGAEANPHGHGFAVITGDRIVTGHGMNAQEMIDAFARVRAAHPDGPALFHSRYATHGIRTVANCHPFRLGGDQRTVLAHNGILPKRVHPGAYDWRSDTRIAAEDYLPGMPFGSLDTFRGSRGLETWLGSSKLLILTVDLAYEQQVYLFGESKGQWDNGIWYSNSSFLPVSHRYSLHERYVCDGCDDVDLYRVGRYCRQCGWCFACEIRFPHCECRPPRAHRRPPRAPGRQLALPTPPQPST